MTGLFYFVLILILGFLCVILKRQDDTREEIEKLREENLTRIPYAGAHSLERRSPGTLHFKHSPIGVETDASRSDPTGRNPHRREGRSQGKSPMER